MSINRKRGSIVLARSLCYQINGAADDSDDMDGGGYGSVDVAEILSAEVVRLQAALAQPEQEPVAFYHPRNGFYWAKPTSIFAPTSVDVERLPLYTAVQRKWVGLTYEEIESAISDGFARGLDNGNISNQTVINYVRGIEAKLKELNNG